MKESRSSVLFNARGPYPEIGSDIVDKRGKFKRYGGGNNILAHVAVLENKISQQPKHATIDQRADVARQEELHKTENACSLFIPIDYHYSQAKDQ